MLQTDLTVAWAKLIISAAHRGGGRGKLVTGRPDRFQKTCQVSEGEFCASQVATISRLVAMWSRNVRRKSSSLMLLAWSIKAV